MPSSGAPTGAVAYVMSNMVVELPYMVGAPGLVSWARVMPARTSALCVTRVPETDTGLEAPDIAIDSTLMGQPQRALSMITSQVTVWSIRGLVGQTSVETIGRSRSSSFPPTM